MDPPIYPVRPNTAPPPGQPGSGPPPYVPPLLRDLFRMPATSANALDKAQLGPEFRTLVVFNPSSVPIYLRWDETAPVVPGSGLGPGGKAYDVACPGSATLTWPIPEGAQWVSALLANAAPVAGDTDQLAIVSVSAAVFPPSTSILA